MKDESQIGVMPQLTADEWLTQLIRTLHSASGQALTIQAGLKQTAQVNAAHVCVTQQELDELNETYTKQLQDLKDRNAWQSNRIQELEAQRLINAPVSTDYPLTLLATITDNASGEEFFMETKQVTSEGVVLERLFGNEARLRIVLGTADAVLRENEDRRQKVSATRQTKKH